MSLSIKPLSEREAVTQASRPSLWRGWFLADIRDAWETLSKHNNPMIAVRLAVFHGAEEREFADYFTASERFAVKLRHACEAIGQLGKYEAGSIAAEDFHGQRVEVRLDVEKGRGGYPPRSVVGDYRRSAG